MLKPIAYHSDLLLKLDLQLFGDDDVILPDGFEMDSPQSEEVAEQEIQGEQAESIEDTKPIEEVSEPVNEPQKLKIKYNHQEEEITLDEAVQLAQMGKNYPKLQEKLQETEQYREFVEGLAQQHGMEVPQYLDAVRQQREQERIDQLVEQGISEELAQEMLENRKFREQFETEKQTKAQEAKQNEEYQEFFDYFKQANNRDFVAGQDEIPPNVWEATQKGVPLKYAYMEHQNNQFKTQLQTLKQNQSNKQKAPVGSLTAHGSNEVASEDDFLAGFNSIK
jgi:hypothetical protein